MQYLRADTPHKHRLRMVLTTRLANKLLSIVFYLFVASLQQRENQELQALFFEKYFLFMTRLDTPSQQILNIMPLLVAKALLVIIETKLKEPLTQLVGSQNSVYLFVMGLFNSSY